MKIVIDTNVVISGMFFGGNPEKVLRSVVLSKQFTACATSEIVDEYMEVFREISLRKHEKPDDALMLPLVKALEIIEPVSLVELCRDPDDDKFIGCAKDAGALYIVSGDNDLLVLDKIDDIEIVTAKTFCERFLNN